MVRGERFELSNPYGTRSPMALTNLSLAPLTWLGNPRK